MSFAYAGATLLFGGNWSFISAAGDDTNVAVFDADPGAPTATTGALGFANPMFGAPTIPATTTEEFVANWTTTSFTFTAPTDGEVTLVVNFGGAQAGQLLFDDFTLTAVPEPSSVMLLGLAGMSLICRRKK